MRGACCAVHAPTLQPALQPCFTILLCCLRSFIQRVLTYHYEDHVPPASPLPSLLNCSRALALSLQLCSALDAAAATMGILAAEARSAVVSAPAGGVPRLLASLLMTGGACQAGEAAALLESSSLEAALAAAYQLAGPAVQQQLALAALPCANAACTTPAPGGGKAALRTSRCSRCLMVRYCSVHCSAQAWTGHPAAHKACCREPANPGGLAAAAAAAPTHPPAAWPAVKRQRAVACPVCGVHLAAFGADGSDHVAGCAAARSERMAAVRAAFRDDPAAAAAAQPEAQAEVQHFWESKTRSEELGRQVQQDMEAFNAGRSGAASEAGSSTDTEGTEGAGTGCLLQ